MLVAMELGSANTATKFVVVNVELQDNHGTWLYSGHYSVPTGNKFGELLRKAMAEFHMQAAHELTGRVIGFNLLRVSCEPNQAWPFSTVSVPCTFYARSHNYRALRA